MLKQGLVLQTVDWKDQDKLWIEKTRFVGLKAKTYFYLIAWIDSSEEWKNAKNKNANGTNKCIIIWKIKIENYKKSSNDDKRMQSIDFIETSAYGMTKDLISEKEEIKCNNTIKQYKND